jgi:hypothetical protein
VSRPRDPGSAGRGLPDPDRGARAAARAPGLCPRCRHVRRVTSGRGSTFLRCLRARDDARYPKYPPQPVLACPGFEE